MIKMTSNNWQNEKNSGRRKGADLVETRAQDTGNLLDDAVGGNKGSVLLRELLDELLVLVQLLQVINGHGVNLGLGSIVNVLGVTEHADAHARAGGVGQEDGSQNSGAEVALSYRAVQVPRYPFQLSFAILHGSSMKTTF